MQDDVENDVDIYIIECKSKNSIFMLYPVGGHWEATGFDRIGKFSVIEKTSGPEIYPVKDLWTIGPNYTVLSTLACAECGGPSYDDYLCRPCREG